MADRYDIQIGVNTGQGKKRIDDLRAAFDKAARSLDGVQNALKKYSADMDKVGTTAKKLQSDFQGIVDVNGKVIKSYQEASIATQKIIADNIGISNTIKSVYKDFNDLALLVDHNVVKAYENAAGAAKRFTQDTIGVVKTVNKVSGENRDLGITLAGNVVGSYAKAAESAKTYSTANLSISNTIRQAADELKRFNPQIEGSGNILRNYANQNFDARFASWASSIKRLNVNILDNSKAFESLRVTPTILDRLTGGFDRAKNGVKEFTKSLHVMHAIRRTVEFGIVNLGASLIGWAFNTHNVASEFLGFRNAIAVASGSIEQANEQLGFAIGVARKYKIDITETTKAYSKFVNAIALSGIPLEEANRQFAILAQVGRVLNVPTVNMRGIFLAIEQMASKGFVSLEELRRQLGEHLPGAVAIAAKAWGDYLNKTISVGEFMDMVSKRSVETSKFLGPFVNRLKEMTDPLVEKSLQKSQAAFVDLSNSVKLLAAALGLKLQSVFSGFAKGLTFLVDSIRGLLPVNEELIAVYKSQLDVLEMADNGSGKFADTIAETKSKLEELTPVIAQSSDATTTFAEKAGGVGIAFAGITSGGSAAIALFSKLKEIFVARVLPTLLKTKEIIIALASKFINFSKLGALFNPYTLAISAFGIAVANFEGVMEKLAMAIYGTEKYVKPASKAVNQFEDDLRGSGLAASASADDIKKYRDEVKRIQSLAGYDQSYKMLELQASNIQTIIDRINASKKAAQDAIDAAVPGAQSIAAYEAAIQSLNIQLKTQQNSLDNIRDSQKSLQNVYNSGMTDKEIKQAETLAEMFGDLNKKLATNKYKAQEAAVMEFVLAENIKLGVGAVGKMAQALLDKAKAYDLLSEKAEKAKKAELPEIDIGMTPDKQYKDYLKDLKDNYNKVADELKSPYTKQNEWYADAMLKAQEYHERYSTSEEEFLFDIERIYALHNDRIAQLGEKQSDVMSEFAKQAARNIQNAFADFLFDPFENGLKGMIISLQETLRRMAAEVLAQKALMALFNAMSGSSYPMISSIGSDMGAAFNSRANGGTAMAGNPYWIGETGQRELFIPETNGSIIPERKLGKDSAGSSDTYNISIIVPGVTNSQEFMSSDSQIINRLSNAIEARKRRG